MTLTPAERQFVKDQKKSVICGFNGLRAKAPDHYKAGGYKAWGTWRLIEIIERLSK